MKVNEINNYILNVQKGDLNSFRFIIDSSKKMAMTLAMSILKNRDNAEDVVQESYILVYQNISKFNFSTKFSTWFYKIVLNQSLQFLRKNKIKLEDIDDTDIIDKISDDKFDFLQNEDISKSVEKCMSNLPEIYSFVLKMYYFDDCDIDEISKVLDVKYSNAKVILHRARIKLKEQLMSQYKDEIKDWL